MVALDQGETHTPSLDFAKGWDAKEKLRGDGDGVDKSAVVWRRKIACDVRHQPPQKQ